MDDTATLDVGGTIFKIPRECLLGHPGTRLTDLAISQVKSKQEKDEPLSLFFNRDPILFHYIINYYRTSELHLPTDICGLLIRKEMEFWQIPETAISPCCWRPLYLRDQDENVERNLINKLKEEDVFVDDLSSSKQLQYKLWLLLDKPNSSRAAKIWNTFFMATIMVSAVVASIESVPSLRYWRQDLADSYNATLIRAQSISPKLVTLIFTAPHQVLSILDKIFLAIFTVEFLLHFITCPKKVKFFKQFTNWNDLIAVSSGLAIVFTELAYTSKMLPESFTAIYILFVLQVAYCCRMLKLFRLSERFIGLKIMLLSVWASKKELLLLIFSFAILAAIFGSTQFYCEFENNNFNSVPTSIWWAVITMTTVGYGDYFPKSALGFVVGSICALVGVLILSMPVAVIAANFNEYYTRSQYREDKKKGSKGSTRFIKVGAVATD